MSKVQAPLFIDPIYGGPADPMMIKNEQTGKYYLFYTQRRASTATSDSVAYCYGTKIGVAEADEGGAYWFYRGTLDLEFEFGENTFWAPEIVWDPASECYHMFVTYIRGIHSLWKGEASIHHYRSEDLFHWTHLGRVQIGSRRIIDPCLYPLPDGGWRMWYKDEEIGSHTCFADSRDLNMWQDRGQATFDERQEGPNVFALGGKYWLLACEWKGQGVYSSDDLTHFVRQDGARLLSEQGTRPMDGAVGRHVDVLTCKDHAYIVYFVHYHDTPTAEAPSAEAHALTAVQMAELRVQSGRLVCNRNDDFDLILD